MASTEPAVWIHDPRGCWPELASAAPAGAEARLVDGQAVSLIRQFAADGRAAPVIAVVEDEPAALVALDAGADAVLTRAELAEGRLALVISRAARQRRAAWFHRVRYGGEIGAAQHTLEAVGRSVSHDLRAPLRAIHGFGQALAEDFGDDLDPMALGFLDRIRAGAERLDDRLQALLRLTEMVRRPFRRGTVDLGEVADEWIEDRAANEPTRTVHWQRDEALIASGDGVLLRRLLAELLENAWVFSSPRSVARIELRRWGDGFVVRDDGAGFGQSYAEKIFDAFSRFHTDDEFPGAGVGLAAARCAVERHGGRIEARGVEERGAMVAFSLDPGAEFPPLTEADLPTSEAAK